MDPSKDILSNINSIIKIEKLQKYYNTFNTELKHVDIVIYIRTHIFITFS